jgi:hypothetical protein
MNSIIASLLIILSSSVKYSLAALAVVAGDMGMNASVMNVVGGIAGIIFFTYLGAGISTMLAQRYPKKFGKKFSPVTRRLVRVKRSFGLAGIAFLTPSFFSIPVGVLFATAITSSKTKIILSMSLSCFFWAAVFFVPYHVFNVNIKTLVAGLF